MMVWSLFIIDLMGLFFYNKNGSIISIGDLPTTNIIEPVLIGKLANDNDAYSAILGIIFIVFSEEVAIIILGTIFIIFSLIKIIILILGIITLIYYKNDNRISFLPSLLLIIGSSIALIPLLGWFGGIIIIIASILFLESLQKFKVEG